jgi:predicted nucleic acid-binding protein
MLIENEGLSRDGDPLERIYLDTSVWCRPFDKPTPRIRREAKAVHRILSLGDEAKIEIIGSGINFFEASLIEVTDKRDAVLALVSRSVTRLVKMKEDMERLAAELIDKCGLSTMDAAHIASAIGGDAQHILNHE